jgi:hypothetical protein
MLRQLEMFKYDKAHFDELQDYRSEEIVMSNRLIKKEVVDMADMVE